MSFASELIDNLSTNLTGSGISKWDDSTQSGLLFEGALPPEPLDGISIGVRAWRQAENGIFGFHKALIHIESQGPVAVEDKHWIVTRWLRDRAGTRNRFSPITLTSWRIDQINWIETGPGLVGAKFIDGAICYTWQQRIEMIVVEI